MKQFLITLAGVFAGLFLFFLVMPFLLILGLAGMAAGSKPSTPPEAVIALDLRGSLTDQDPDNPFALFGGGGLSVMKVVEVLHHAETDSRVKAVMVRLPEGGMAPAAAEELRLSFKRLRAAGKPVVAHSQGFYPAGTVISSYMLGAAAGELWMQENASFQATGIATEEWFLKRFFDRYGLKADFEQRYEYKNAPNSLLHTDYTPAHREATLSWMGSLFDNAVAAAAVDRKQDPKALRATLVAGPWSAEQARAKGLIDRIGQPKELEEEILKRAGERAELIDFSAYASTVSSQVRGSAPAIAVVGGEGPIVTGDGSSGGSVFGSDATLYSDRTAQAIYDAIKDDKVKAIVFRVSSPGGSDVASEQVLGAVRAAKKAGKPVVVSMGTYAASGGYWISSEADAIVAQPSTLTGSIGVFGGKLVLGDAAGRFGVDVRDASVGGGYATAFSSGQGFTPAQRQAISQWMDRIYDDFVQRVATGRKLSPERVREIAKGRVWTGAQAKNLGLVDELGGYHEALAKAKALAKIPADQDVRIVRFPAARSPFEALSRALGVSGESVRVIAAAGWILGDPRAQAAMDRMAEQRLREQGHAAVLADRPLN